MKPLHRRLGTILLDGLRNFGLEAVPIVEWLDAQELEEWEELFDIVLKWCTWDTSARWPPQID
jgi:hypothetical protein